MDELNRRGPEEAGGSRHFGGAENGERHVFGMGVGGREYREGERMKYVYKYNR